MTDVGDRAEQIGREVHHSKTLDRDFAEHWYREGWLRAWNENEPELCKEILTEDFVLDTPTTRHTRLDRASGLSCSPARPVATVPRTVSRNPARTSRSPCAPS